MSNLGGDMSLPFICDNHHDMLQSHKYLIRNVTMKAYSPHVSKHKVMCFLVSAPHHKSPMLQDATYLKIIAKLHPFVL